jgi:hypothetical protein
MTPLAIRLSADTTAGDCTLCGEPAGAVAGLQLCVADGAAPVCRACGKQRAPLLVNLLDLAQTASRIGALSRRALWVPLEALLELAQAAEKYTTRAPTARGSGASGPIAGDVSPEAIVVKGNPQEA